MYAAYETLSDGLKDTLKNMYGRHSSRHVFGTSRAERNDDTVGRIINSDKAKQDAIHPVVITHPQTGKKVHSLILHSHLDLMDGVMKSRNHYCYLYSHATKPEFTCRFGM